MVWPWWRIPQPRLSLRLRLTVFYTVILCLALIVFGVFLSLTLARTLYGEVDRSIAGRARQVNNTVWLSNWPFAGSIEVPRPDAFAEAGTFVQVSDLDGKVLAVSDNLGAQRLPIDGVNSARSSADTPSYRTVEVNGDKLRVYSLPLTVDGRTMGLVQVARTLTPIEDTLARLHILLTLGVVLCLALCMAVGWLLAHTALSPLDEMTKTAQTIGQARDFSQRVQHRGPPDEIWKLADTFNGMLEQLESSYAELQAAYEQVEASLSSQRRFTADASHELRTPLTTILGNASLLQQTDEMTAEDRQASIAQIHAEAERMNRLVQDLLALARLDAGQSTPRQPVDLRSLVDEVTAQGRLLAQGVEVRMGDLSEAVVEGDRDHLKQLLLILVDNALKYTRQGGQVILSLRCASRFAEVLVRDTGVGIARRDLPHIFERFYRGDRARKAGGTGLGLSIAQRIAREHGGHIAVDSEPGRGSMFTVRLPRRSRQQTDRSEDRNAHQGSETRSAP
ncbi:MAG: HAMP domain-containing protein [Chloroflexota bacterium]|nr:MAG: HAMP domain-containing protein [Chloroflexota bacterium]